MNERNNHHGAAGSGDDSGLARPGLPSSLAGLDPFAGPRSVPVREARQGVGPADGGDPVAIPCPCVCKCGNDTDKTFGQVESLSASRHLRCAACAAAGHLGAKWLPEETTGGEESPGVGVNDVTATGSRSGEQFVIRQRPHRDPEDEEWDRQIALRLAAERREAARQRWLDGLPERWQLPYDEGEALVPQVEERLQRFKASGGEHGTSLLCIGPFGSGKTWVAYTYARAAVDRWLLWPQEIRIGTEAEIMEPLAMASPWELAEKAAALLKPTLKMLIIDDVGTAAYRNVENRHATFTKVVNWMYEHKRALVITTNKALGSDGELDKWIGPTAYERLRHMVGANQVFRDEDKRAEMTALWEAEYQSTQARKGRD